MNKHLSVVTVVLFSLWLAGCVPTDVHKPHYKAGTQENVWGAYDPENVDMSDIDENLTETETLITENMPDERVPRIEFPLDEYRSLARSGKGTIKGKIYLTNSYGGSQVLGGGTRLYLNPMTSYSNQWYEVSYIGGKKMQKADARLFNYLRFTAAESDGSFSFYGVPSGKYFLIGTVQCGEECGYATTKSIRLATKVEVYGNQVKVKDLTRKLD
ncbi:carboxypeptidase regulatory-like domain-containing protein [Sulfurovum sp. zt1-1]|uniref:Carboxypeptidase regulatory-like domain-containing protein n=1 Tax=Sulfurovum zhangzhouensis TaxID=3019067 RepID=A0ABT7QX71_9BACT|nr:carboxypeptidase regulatory-like domain-containing protein [Sulfurovum zhangzhouensis]MDM5270936.1 carboxypeptidase regulatory-like domain-containing protein [Sulfurovum zhangzhouensis]